jgi:hypothetical protein
MSVKLATPNKHHKPAKHLFCFHVIYSYQHSSFIKKKLQQLYTTHIAKQQEQQVN